jgi:hypothetical protein
VKAGRALRLAGRVLAITAVVLAVLAVRAVLSSRDELAQGDRARASGDVDGAIAHYRRAVRWYAPGNPYGTDALAALAAIGAEAEAEGDVDRALSAYRSIRGAILSTRSTFTPHADALAAADARIADLVSGLPPPPIDADRSRGELRAEHLALLSNVSRPSVPFTILLLVGFAAFVGGVAAFVTRALDEEDRVVPAEARRWGTVAIVGFGLFVIGMALA